MILLDQLQSHFACLLESLPAFRQDGAAWVHVAQNDGTYPNLATLEEARAGKLEGKAPGVALIVHYPEAVDMEDVAQKGNAIIDVAVHVVVEECVTVARSTASGHSLTAPTMARWIMESLSGKPLSTKPGHTIRLSAPPFQDFGVTNGLRRIVVSFECRCYIEPSG